MSPSRSRTLLPINKHFVPLDRVPLSDGKIQIALERICHRGGFSTTETPHIVVGKPTSDDQNAAPEEQALVLHVLLREVRLGHDKPIRLKLWLPSET
jgi:hypothetical protein